MATSRTIITILEELGDEDFKSFKWHLSEEKRIPRQIPYAQLEKLDRVDTSAKIKQIYGTERGLRFMMLILEVIDKHDLKERYSHAVSAPKRREEADILLPDITDTGATERWHDQEGAVPEGKRGARGSQYKKYSFMAVGLLCAIVGNILMVVATATDYWHGWPSTDGRHYLRGLWKQCIDNICKNMDDEWVTANHTAGAFMILCCMLCFAGIIVSFSQRFKRSLAAGILFLLSGFFVLLTMAIYTGMTYASFQSDTDWFFSWSYRLGWGATGMVLFAGIFYMCAYRNRGTGPR